MTDKVAIRIDGAVIHAYVTEISEPKNRPDNGARLSGTLDADDTDVHYVDYWHDDGRDHYEELRDVYGDLIDQREGLKPLHHEDDFDQGIAAGYLKAIEDIENLLNEWADE